MKTPFIHRGMFAESLRRLRLAGILLTAIPLALAIPRVFFAIVGSSPYYAYNFIDIYPFLYALPFVAPPVLMAILFTAQTKRCDSDFYHSLPLTKRCLCTTWLVAVISWLSIIVIGSSAVVWSLSLLRKPIDSVSALLPIGGVFLASLMVTAVLFLAYALSGNTVTTLFFTVIVLFAPIAMAYMLSLPLSEYNPVISVEAADLTQYQLLYGNEDKPLTWVVTALITVVCLLLGYAAAAKRRSELAGQAATTRALQTVLRLILAYVFCLPALYAVFFDSDAWLAVLCYVFALTVYFLFELFTTKKAKNMLKAIPWLSVLVVLNVLTVIGMNISQVLVYRFSPTADDVHSISITELHEFYTENDKYYTLSWNEEVSVDIEEIYKSTENGTDDIPPDDLGSADSYYSPDDFWFYESVYHDYHAEEIELTDKALIAVACEALSRNLEYSKSDHYRIVDRMIENDVCEVYYRVTIAYHSDLTTQYRTVWLYSGEFVELFDAVLGEWAHIPNRYGAPI